MTHSHQFDPVSGWCGRCNLRSDGRLIGKGGDVYRAGPYAANDEDHIDQIVKTMKERA